MATKPRPKLKPKNETVKKPEQKNNGKDVPKIEPVQGSNEAATQGQTSLKEAIAESRDAIASASGVKRPVGRPRKDADVSAKPENSKASVEAKPETQSIIVDTDTIAMGYAMGTTMLAEMRGFPGWQMSEETCKRNAQLTDAVLKQYLPQVESAHAAAMSLGFSLVTWAVFTAIAERAHKAAIVQNKPVEEKPVLHEVTELPSADTRPPNPLAKQLAKV